MAWKEPSERHSEAMAQAIHEAAHIVATAIREGFKHMADVEAQALSDLTDAVNAMTSVISQAATEISTLFAQLQNIPSDHSAAIEAQVNAIKSATATLGDALKAATTPPPTPAPAPAAPAAPTPASPPTA